MDLSAGVGRKESPALPVAQVRLVGMADGEWVDGCLPKQPENCPEILRSDWRGIERRHVTLKRNV